MDKIIFHIDVNSAFLSWEAAYRLTHKGAKTDLREIPSAVGGDMSMRHGIILAKSIPAKKYGITTGETVIEAKQKCPALVLVPPNYNLYQQCSSAFMNVLTQYSDTVEQYSIDEAYVDMTSSHHLFGGPENAAWLIKERIKDELGFTVNIGISNNKLLAKMASDFKKPDMLHTLFPEEIQKKMWPLPVADLFFVGRATEKKLRSFGIHTVGELATADKDTLKSVLKKQGEIIWNFANGIDLSPVIPQPPANKGYGNSTTTPHDLSDVESVHKVLLALSETVGNRLRRDGVEISIISVGVRRYDMSYFSHQKALSAPTNITLEIYHAACSLFDEMWDGAPVRHLGIHTSRVQADGFFRQLCFWDCADYETCKKMDAAVDQIRERYGIDAVKRAVFLGQDIDHMSGGISREKREVDYSKEPIY